MFDKKYKPEEVGNNSTCSQLKLIVKKNFPVKVDYQQESWDLDSNTFKNHLEKKYLHVGIVFIPKNLTNSSFELWDKKGKICTYHFMENSIMDYCDVFEGDSIEVVEPKIMNV